MSHQTLALLAVLLLLVLIFLRMPIGLAMMLVGFSGSWLVYGDLNPLLQQMKSIAYSQFSVHSLSIVPLFLLMGQFASLGGISQALFKAAEAFVGHRRGGVAMAAIGACAGFGSICGSSLATAATMGQVALPELKRLGYHGGFAGGALAAGGTLGILIPPSIVLVIYATLTEQNIAKLFTAAMVPGLLAAFGYIVVIMIVGRFRPLWMGHPPEKASRQERWHALMAIWPVLAIFIIVIGGINLGIFTPTEGAAVGVVATGVLSWVKRGLTTKRLLESFEITAGATAMIFSIILGAAAFNNFMALSGLPQALASWVSSMGWSPWLVLVSILVFYIISGCFLDELSIMLLTVPIFFPMIMGMDFGLTPEETAIWFGILILIVVEIGLIAPPVGLNLFVIQSMAPEIAFKDIAKGVWPFVISDFVRTAILVAFPSISLVLLRWLH